MVRAEVRSKNLAYLDSLGFRVTPSLPVDSTLPGLRPKEDIVQRLLALEVLFSWVARPDEIVEVSVIKQLQNWLTPSEIKMLDVPRDEANKTLVNTIGWKLENMWPLAWVLGFDKKPEVDGNPITQTIRDSMLQKFMPALPRRFKLRSEETIAELEDLFYCAHNAVRSAQLGKKTAPENFHPILNGGVIHERRHSLAWCLSRQRSWDDTDLST